MGLELQEGLTIFSRAAQKHAAARHPDDYSTIAPHVAAIIANPLYVGDDFNNGGKIELIGTAAGLEGFALIAVSIIADTAGHYHVASVYPVSRSKIEGRRNRGFLKLLI